MKTKTNILMKKKLGIMNEIQSVLDKNGFTVSAINLDVKNRVRNIVKKGKKKKVLYTFGSLQIAFDSNEVLSNANKIKGKNSEEDDEMLEEDLD